MEDQLLWRLMTGETVSGMQMSEEAGLTRAAIWKQVQKLREAGFGIESRGRQGYRLVSCPDSLRAPVIAKGLDTQWAGRRIAYYEEVDSTNRVARRMAAEGAPEGTLVVADAQSEGRGRRGRSWMSRRGEGIAMSLVLRPCVHPSQVAMLSLQTAVAVALGVEEATGLQAGIKWPNDVVVGGKKICGMLLEMTGDEQMVREVIAGIGINVHEREFPEEFAKTASSLDLQTGRTLRRADVVRAVLRGVERARELERRDELMRVYREHSVTLGSRVRVISPGETFEGEAQDLTQGGGLKVRTDDGACREVLAGDVSVRGIMGYV